MNIVDVIRAIVRPLLTVIGFGALTFGFIFGLVGTDLYVPIVAMMIAFWFGQRNSGERTMEDVRRAIRETHAGRQEDHNDHP